MGIVVFALIYYAVSRIGVNIIFEILFGKKK